VAHGEIALSGELSGCPAKQFPSTFDWWSELGGVAALLRRPIRMRGHTVVLRPSRRRAARGRVHDTYCRDAGLSPLARAWGERASGDRSVALPAVQRNSSVQHEDLTGRSTAHADARVAARLSSDGFWMFTSLGPVPRWWPCATSTRPRDGSTP